MLTCVVLDLRHQFVDHPEQRGGEIGRDLAGTAVVADRSCEELPGRSDVALLRDQHVDDLAVVVDSTVDVPPHTGDLHVGLVDEPAVTDSMTADGRLPRGSARSAGPSGTPSRGPPRHRVRREVLRRRGRRVCNAGTSGPRAGSRPTGTGNGRTGTTIERVTSTSSAALARPSMGLDATATADPARTEIYGAVVKT